MFRSQGSLPIIHLDIFPYCINQCLILPFNAAGPSNFSRGNAILIFMIKINDLRIGNYTKIFNRTGKGKRILVITVKGLFQIESGALNVFPIDLVDAWLPRFGFSHEENVFHSFHLSPGYVVHEPSGWFFMKRTIRMNEHPVLYVHQFQNLFYGLTGEELIIVNL